MGHCLCGRCVGILQVLEYLSETYGWPPQLRKVAVLALLVGLPIVFVVAWYHGDRGDQRVGRNEFAILTLLVTLGGGALWRYQSAIEFVVPGSAPDIDAAGRTRGCGSAPIHRGSAIRESQRGPGRRLLRRRHPGRHPDAADQGRLAQGIARTSSELLRGSRLSTREIGERLGVTKLLQGRVQRAGDRVRINVLLIDTTTESQEWAERYDRELTA